jgi:hypothetical protein
VRSCVRGSDRGSCRAASGKGQPRHHLSRGLHGARDDAARRGRSPPPAPIGDPGLASIQAAAHPANVDYLYYVRKPKSIAHYFTADESDFLHKVCQFGYACD